MKKRVVVAMSGGVDSSVAAYLLKKQGYDVVGVTMCFGVDVGESSSKNKPSCCGIIGIEDAKKIAAVLKIPHYVLNFAGEFKKYVISDFEKEYLSGRTPNPCIRCNDFLKFGVLLNKLKKFNADYLATGHYARIKQIRNSKFEIRNKSQIPNYFLQKAKDKKKDQTYFLYRLTQEQLRHILFPLGNLTKEEVRKIARYAKLPVADKPGSQEICFLGGTNYKDYLKNRFGDKIKEGLFVDSKGKTLGKHKGIAYYTIGQRQGLGVSFGRPMYVIEIDAKKNQVVLGEDKQRYSSSLIAKEVIFSSRNLINSKLVLLAKIRYNQKDVKVKVFLGKDRLRVEFIKPVMSIAPGQAIVLYNRDKVVGGAIIEKAVK